MTTATRSARKNAFSGSTAISRAWIALYGIAGSFALSMSAHAQGLPSGGSVSAGAATIATAGDTLTVAQTSQTAAINWQSFNIAADKSVRFVQPDSNSIALNRVLGADPSTILGNLSANGKVFLINPNGVLFGRGAQVAVGGLVASTLNLSDAEFMAGRYGFSGTSGKAVLNQGTITAADGGYVALLGANVSNQGLIVAQLGTVALAGGERVTLDVAGDGLLNVAVDTGAVNALVGNGGMIRADGGSVILTAQAAGQLLRTVVNNSGVIEAGALEMQDGAIRLLGDAQSGAVNITGTLDASGGGLIVATAHGVDISGQARIVTSGEAKGGSVLIGGGYRGQDAGIAHATNVVLRGDAMIAADAVLAGNGGTVVLWSDGSTIVDGAISARGGVNGGNGGLVETSGRQVSIGTGASVNTLATRGATGLWLLDPVDYRIAIAGGDETPSQVTISLASSNRLIEATHDITVADAITWTTPQMLELRAGNDVIVNAAMTASTAGSLMRMTAGRDVLINAALTASGNGSLIELNAAHDIILNEAITASGGGAVMMRADNDGTGGANGGTVHLNPLFPVTTTSKTIYYSPENGYAAPNLYTGFTSHMWVFVAANDKSYDGNNSATATFRGDPTVGGARSVGLAAGSIAFADKNVGTDKAVAFSGYDINGADAAAYALFASTGQTYADITPAMLTVTADDASKTYGQTLTLADTAFTSAGLVSGETIGSVTAESDGAIAGAPVDGSPYAITPSAADGGTFSASNYIIGYVNGVLTIAPAPLVITANDATKVYGDPLAFADTAYVATGLVNGDMIGAVTATSDGAVASAGVGGGPYAISASGAVGGTYVLSNYVTSYVAGALTITPAPLSVIPNDVAKTEGTTYVFDSTGFSSDGLKNGDAILTVSMVSPGATSTARAEGGPYVTTASNAAGPGYNPTNYVTVYAAGAMTVNAAPVVVTPPVVVIPPVVVTPPVEVTPPVIVAPPVEVTPPVVVTLPVEVTSPVVVALPVEMTPPVVVTPPVEVTPPVVVAPPVIITPPVEVTPPLVITPPVDVIPPVVLTPPIVMTTPAVIVTPPISMPPTPRDANVAPSSDGRPAPDGGKLTTQSVTPESDQPRRSSSLQVLDGGVLMPEHGMTSVAGSTDNPAVAPVTLAPVAPVPAPRPIAYPPKQDRN